MVYALITGLCSMGRLIVYKFALGPLSYLYNCVIVRTRDPFSFLSVTLYLSIFPRMPVYMFFLAISLVPSHLPHPFPLSLPFSLSLSLSHTLSLSLFLSLSFALSFSLSLSLSLSLSFFLSLSVSLFFFVYVSLCFCPYIHVSACTSLLSHFSRSLSPTHQIKMSSCTTVRAVILMKYDEASSFVDGPSFVID